MLKRDELEPELDVQTAGPDVHGLQTPSAQLVFRAGAVHRHQKRNQLHPRQDHGHGLHRCAQVFGTVLGTELEKHALVALDTGQDFRLSVLQ